jgi:starvation-inducible outer membrane lipoprotein
MNKKTLNKPKLKLIKRKKAYSGYLIGNIKEVLEPERFAEFESWISGQTVGIYKGKIIVYQYDLIRFLKGLPILD